MRIKVHDGDDFRLDLPLPTGLVFNRLTASFAAKAAAEAGVTVTSQQMHRLFDHVKRCKKAHPDWVLVEVTNKDGEYVMVKL